LNSSKNLKKWSYLQKKTRNQQYAKKIAKSG
jgi:hypothetical protein